jgi:hypothetical protein
LFIECLEKDIARKRGKLAEIEGEDNFAEREKIRRQIDFNERLAKQSNEELAKIKKRITNL